MRFITLAHALVHKEYQKDSEIILALRKSFDALYYTAYTKEAEIQANLFFSKPSRDNPFEVFF